ncbi:hypothetical protein BZY71_16320 [Leclercia adecarboxylata]|nr:hypothetical protein BZY71_16320 [Leclercia adecarboxylata]
MLSDSLLSCVANFLQSEAGILFTAVITGLVKTFFLDPSAKKRLSNTGCTNPGLTGLINFITAHQTYLRRMVQGAQFYQKQKNSNPDSVPASFRIIGTRNAEMI